MTPATRRSASGDMEDTQSSETSTESQTDENTEAKSESTDAPFYCPGCGLRYEYRQKCTGRPEAPHPPIEVVSTDELSGDPAKHTPAPNTDNLG